MKQITVKVSGHDPRVYPLGTPASEIFSDIDPSLAKHAVAVKVNSEVRDWNRSVEEDAELEVITTDSEEGHDILLHSTAHLMAQAVKELMPTTKITIGPTIENRFYYDFDVDTPFTDKDIKNIQGRMREIAKMNFQVKRQVLTKEEAYKIFNELDEDYKLEIIDDIEDGTPITTYSQDDFIDLCRGPHLPSTGVIKHFKLLNTAGAYWRGDENNKMLQRIYGTAFYTKDGLKSYLTLLEQAKKNDHRKLGKALDLFLFSPLSPGNPFFLPNGTIVYNELLKFLRELYQEYGYQEVISPQMYDIELWKRSGHWELFQEYMYKIEMNDKVMGMKPMNCPGHTIIYSSSLRSYRDLPFRIADFGRLHRFERAGVLSGLTRVRSFIVDDAHIFCTIDQIESEMESLLKMIKRIYDVFDFFDFKVSLSTRPDKALGDKIIWEKAETILHNTLKHFEIDYSVDQGEGAFYGPKIDFFVKDALRRSHQLGTIQLDFTLPERFNLLYVASDGSEKRPVMIHRAILGSIERFFGVYLEHCGGDFPLWLAPIQIIILPVSEKSTTYSKEIFQKLKTAGLRVKLDNRQEKIGAKIRQAELKKINIMLIIGEREKDDGTVSVRRRFEGDLGQQNIDNLIPELLQEIKERRRTIKSQK